MTPRRLLLVLAPLGTLVAHASAYGVFGARHGDDVRLHAYLPAVAAIVVPGAVGSLLWVTTFRRGRAAELPGVRSLVAAQVGVFACQEVAERLASHIALSDLFTQPAVCWGLALQLFAAAGLVVGVRLARRTVTAFLSMAGRCRVVVEIPCAPVAFARGVRVVAAVRCWAPARAPPAVAI